MSDDESDYMSDNFLVDGIKEDIRPGLVKSRTEKRQNELAKKKEECDSLNKVKNKSIKVIEKEKLQLGLQNPITNSNKGYALLEKMGYTPGSSLGKCGAGLTEPIPVPTQRNFREGLGVRAALAEMREEKMQKRLEEKVGEPSINVFRARTREEVTEREARIDLYKSQKACHSLDSDEEMGEESINSRKDLAKIVHPLKAEKRKQQAEERLERLLRRQLLRAQRAESKKSKKGSSDKMDNISDHSIMAIVPEDYPTSLLTRQQSDELHKMLLNEIAESTSPRIHSFDYEEEFGASIVKCIKKSKPWVRSTINKILLSGGVKLCTRKASSISKVIRGEAVCIGFLIPGGPIKKKKILKRLTVQNPELDVSQWSHSTTLAVKKKFCLIKLLIPESDLKILKALGNHLCFGFYKRKIFLLDKSDKVNYFPPSLETYMQKDLLEGTFTAPELTDSEEDKPDITDWFEKMASSLLHSCS